MEDNTGLIIKQEPLLNDIEGDNQSDTLAKEELFGCDVKQEEPNLEENIRLFIKQEPSPDVHVVNEGDDNNNNNNIKCLYSAISL